MKKMIKTVAMVAAMFVAVSTVAKAQDAQQQGRRGGGRGPNVVSLLKDSLHVSDAVAAKADSIVKVYQAKNQELMQSANGDMQAVRPKMQELRTEQANAIKALLTDEQKAAYDKLMASMGGGRRGGGM
jgi:Spy/CpxP family protein refolding chaperone